VHTAAVACSYLITFISLRNQASRTLVCHAGARITAVNTCPPSLRSHIDSHAHVQTSVQMKKQVIST